VFPHTTIQQENPGELHAISEKRLKARPGGIGESVDATPNCERWIGGSDEGGSYWIVLAALAGAGQASHAQSATELAQQRRRALLRVFKGGLGIFMPSSR
jgi:hypothetical protein